ncbi:MAG: TldD/PmbA family protein [Tenericutes bacterium]|nr:TldD/PmbA family protein [Mycoplasmatota bacterium]
MEKIIELLNKHPQVDEWQFVSNDISSTELFFIKDELQMNRAKDVSKYLITVFKNFEVEGKKFKGSSSTNLSPTFTEEEINKAIDQAALAASFVMNEYYDIPNPTNNKAPEIKSSFSDGNPLESISNLVKDLYSEDQQYKAFINSAEFFINKRDILLKNSKGLDVSYTNYRGEIELVTEAMGSVESIELFNIIRFSDYDQEAIKKTIKDQLYQTSLRAIAIPLPQVGNIPVILDGKASAELWSYYISQASASSKYEHLHNNTPGDNLQGEDIIGDKVTITVKPVIGNSSRDTYYDMDGFFLKEKVIVEEGIFKNYYATKKFADYLNCEATGAVGNAVVSPGKFTEKELKQGKYLEVISFSAFQANAMTGDFGGEFRLAIYFDGEKEIPVTLGVVSANIKEAQKEMFLSKELTKTDQFIGPKIIKFNKMTIAGN